MLGSRIATAAVLLVAFAALLFFAPRWLWIAFCAVALAAAAWEWGRLAKLRTLWNALFAAVLVALFAGAALRASSDTTFVAYGAALLFWVIGAPLWLWFRPSLPGPLVPALAGLVVLTPAFLAVVELREAGAAWLLALMAIAWVSDTAAYFAGRRFGRRKLAPAISPGKTWEGFWGAMIAVAVYACLLGVFAEPMLHGRGTLEFVVMALVLAVLGVVGDLLESQLKRSAGVKDSGTVLPGHGGVLDRIDALLPLLPAAALAFGQ